LHAQSRVAVAPREWVLTATIASTRRDVMSLLTRTGRFAGYELWRGAAKADECKRVKAGA
jgi:hypothetical protein